jgi:hypothetical protein
MIWKPSFMLQHGRQGGWDVLAARGNTLTLMRSERVEAVVERVMPTKEIGRMMGKEKGENEKGEEERERGDFGRESLWRVNLLSRGCWGNFAERRLQKDITKGITDSTFEDKWK